MRPLLVLLGLGVVEAHRLDEYLEATLLSIEPHGIRGELRLAPGVAVLPSVLGHIDTDSSGDVSPPEARAYARVVLADLDLLLDGQRHSLKLGEVRFPSREQLAQGLGEIRIDFTAAAVSSAGSHEIWFRNRHQRGISVYLVNCVAPSDARLHIEGQQRSYDQSEYRVRFSRRAAVPGPSSWVNAGAIVTVASVWLMMGRAKRTIARP